MPGPVDRGHELAALIDSLSDQFTRELQTILKNADRALKALIASDPTVANNLTAMRALLLKRQIRELLTAAGYEVAVEAGVESAAERFSRSFLAAHEARGAEALLAKAGPRLGAMQALMRADLFEQGSTVSTQLWRALMATVLTPKPMPDILADLDSILDIGQAKIATLFDTQVSIYGRLVEAQATEDLPPDQIFKYVGPQDDKTREFCSDLAGAEMTRAEIDELDNGQLPNCFLTCGGYSCRHSWMAVER